MLLPEIEEAPVGNISGPLMELWLLACIDCNAALLRNT